MEKQVVKLTEKQLRNIVSCVVANRENIPPADKVVVAGEGWEYTFVVFLSKKSGNMPSLN